MAQNKLIKKLMKLPLLKIFSGALIKYAANRKAAKIASHFTTYFAPVVAERDETKSSSYKLRHEVYCDEMKFLPKTTTGLESDQCDKHSIHCLLEHINLKVFAGTVRVVFTRDESELLPFEIHCGDCITDSAFHPKSFPRETICEVSRLAVPSSFRRRKTDNHDGSATGVINENNYSETEVRCFPFIAISLYLMATAVIKRNGMEHVFVMMEPRLARSMSFVGIQFKQIGPTVEYHGTRAPYYLNINDLINGLNTGFKGLYRKIEQQL